MKCEGGLRMGRGERPDGVSLKQEWQMDYILRADLDQLLLAALEMWADYQDCSLKKKKKKDCSQTQCKKTAVID